MDKNVLAFLKLDQVQAKVPLSRSGIYAKIKEGKFPAPVPLDGRAVGWLPSEIDAWIMAQVSARPNSHEVARKIARILETRDRASGAELYADQLANGAGFQPQPGEYHTRIAVLAHESGTAIFRFLCQPGRPYGRVQITPAVVAEFLRSLVTSNALVFDFSDLTATPLTVAVHTEGTIAHIEMAPPPAGDWEGA